MNLPNALTLSRLLAVPVLMALLIVSFPYHDQLAAGVFFVASLTDTLDGNLARRRGQVTELGKFLDPLADKLFILSVLIVLVQEGELAAWVVVVIFGRELLITVLRSLGASQGQVIAATPWGKTKTVLQVLAVILLILQRPYPSLEVPAEVGRPEGLAATGSAPGSGSPVNPLVRRLHEALSTRGLTLAVAESCTGGLLAAAITDQPGSSAYFKGGIVAYSNEIKERLLGVPGELLARHGAVSAEVARAMAEGVRRRLEADLALSITGIAGPDADGTEKPVGLTHIWVDSDRGGEGRRFVFDGDRWQNRHRAVAEALALALARVGATP